MDEGTAVVDAAHPCPCIYVASNEGGGSNPPGSVTAYPATANGDVAPIRVIGGSRTRLDYPQQIAVGADGDIYVPNGGDSYHPYHVTVYKRTANGNVAPIRAIEGISTGLALPDGVAADATGRLYVANANGGPNGLGSVTVYAAGAHGDAKPIATISGDKTELANPTGIVLDAKGALYVANGNDLVDHPAANGLAGLVTIYAHGSNGNVPPVRTIKGTLTGLAQPDGVALDSTERLYVTNAPISGQNGITVYAPRANGNAKPIRTIGGANTQIYAPVGIAVGRDGEVYVANDRGGPSGYGSVTVYAAHAHGDVAPVRTVTGSNTQMLFPVGLALR